MLLIASCDKPQSENKATSSSSVDTEDGGAKPEAKPVVDGGGGGAKSEAKLDPKPVVDGDDGGDKPVVDGDDGEAKPEHSFSFLQASHRIERTANSYTKAVTEAHKPTDDDRTIAYSSSNTTIATVDNKGVVEFKTAGTVTITAEKQKKGKHLLRSAQYTLYITVKPVNGVALKAEITRAIAAHGGTVDLNYIDTSAIIHMTGMFRGVTAFNGDISKWDVSRVTDMSYMFYGATAFNGDISKWDVSQVTTMEGMFANATAFNQDISAWDVAQVTTMNSMFYGATAFNQNISAWNVSKVINMNGMFQGATAFNQDLGSWGTKLHANIRVNNMREAYNMFKNSGVSPVPSWCTGVCNHRPTR